MIERIRKIGRIEVLVRPLRLVGTWFLLMIAMAVAGAGLAHAAGYPAFPSGTTWFNVSKPLTHEQLHGRAVLLDFFTPGCINCIHMIPVEQRLKHHFGDDLLVVGVTSPKFTASRDADNMTPFLRRYGIDDPVFIDANMTWWRNFGVYAWPTVLLLDPDGNVVHSFVGERTFDQMKGPIAAVIAEAKQRGTLTRPALPLKPLNRGSGTFSLPSKVAVDEDRIAISDSGHNRVLIYNRAGKQLAVIGGGDGGKPGFRDGSYKDARFALPQGLAFHGDTLYVADTDNQRIRAIDLKQQTVRTIAGNGVRQYGWNETPDPLKTPLNSPWALAYAKGQLYIAMAGDHQIWRLDLDKNAIGPYAGSGAEGLRDGQRLLAEFAQPSGLSMGEDKLYDVDPESSSVREIDLRSNHVMTLVGRGLFNFGFKNGRADEAELQHTQGIAWTKDALYLADTFNNAIRKVDLKTMQVTTVTVGLAQPNGLAVLDAHTLLVADTNHDRLVTVDTRTGKISPWPGT